MRREERFQVFPRSATYGHLVAGQRVTERGSGAEHHAAGCPGGDGRGAVGDAAQICQDVGPHALQVALGEVGVQRDVSQDGERVAPGGIQAVRCEQNVLSAGLGSQVAAEELHLVGDLGRRASAGALGKHGRSQVGKARTSGGIGGRAGPDYQAERDSRQSLPLKVQNVQSVVQRGAAGHRRREGRASGGVGGASALYLGLGRGPLGLWMYRQLDHALAEHRRGVAQVVYGERQVAVHVFVDEGGVSGEGVVVVELVGPAAEPAEAFELEDVRRLDAVLGALELALVHVALANPLDLSQDLASEALPESGRGWRWPVPPSRRRNLLGMVVNAHVSRRARVSYTSDRYSRELRPSPRMAAITSSAGWCWEKSGTVGQARYRRGSCTRSCVVSSTVPLSAVSILSRPVDLRAGGYVAEVALDQTPALQPGRSRPRWPGSRCSGRRSV